MNNRLMAMAVLKLAYLFRSRSVRSLDSILVAVLLIAACGGGSESNPSPVLQEQEKPMRAGALMVKPLMDIANVGQPYENTVRIVPNDPRNEVISLSISNPTMGGAEPSIDNIGKVTWTANDADFARTRTLSVTAKLKTGNDVTVVTPVVVRNERLVYQVTLGADDANYSDPDGRYLVRVKRRDSSQPIVGTLQIVEMFEASGHFVPEYRIINESNTDLVVIEQPVIELPVSNLVVQPRSRARAAAQAGAYPLLVRQSFSIPFPPVQGSEVADGVNVYSSRSQFTYRGLNWQHIVVVKNTEAPQVFSFLASCDSAQTCREGPKPPEKPKSPIILIHGFNPEIFGLGGGEGTWGKLPDALIAKGHPVFEMQWMTQMRFEEVAGTLAKFGQAVAVITGNKPIIIAHSFGGVAAHLALQGRGIEFTGSTWQPVNVRPDDVFSQMITLDSPLSGVSDSVEKDVIVDTAGTTHKFTVGRNRFDVTIDACSSVTCMQAGAFDMHILESNWIRSNVWRIDPSLPFGSAVFTGESIARIQNGNTTVPFLTVVGIHSRPFDDYFPDVKASTVYKLGDGLISLMGQAYNPEDFADDAYNDNADNADNADNDFQIRFLRNDVELRVYEDMDLGECGQHIHPVGNGQARTYWICIAAAHTTSAIHRSTDNDYSIANYEDPLSETPPLGLKYYYHPLKKLIDDPNRIAKPVEPYKPTITVSTTGITNGATGISANTVVSSTFSAAIDASTLNTSTFALSGPSGLVTGAVTYNAATNTATFTPSAPLAYITAYTATITTSVKALTGDPLASNYSWEFTIAGAPPSAPTGVSATAGNGQTTISWNAVTGAVAYFVYVASVSGVTKTNYGSLADGMQRVGVASPYTYTGLTNDKSYYFVVTAVGASGESSESSQVLVTPQASPTNGGFTVSGSVMDENSNGISNAVVELVANGIKYSTTSDSAGSYFLHLNSDQASHLPATFAVNAYEPINHNPSSKGFLLSAGNKVVNNFVLLTVSGNPQLVTIDLVPEIHHIGNSSFAGAQNSQFQFPTAEAATFARSFSISAAQKVYASAVLTFIAKGVQCRDEVWLNTIKVQGLQNSDQRGAFTSYTVPFDPSILVQGSNNAFQIKSVVCSGRDTDDFEFSNVQINFR